MSRLSARHEWVLSGLRLTAPETRPKSGYWFTTSAAGLDLGSPEASNSVRETLALDGDDVVTDRWGNRVIPFTIAICGYTAQDIANGERALSPLIGVPGTLEFLPPESGPRTLYRVRTSTLKASFADLPFLDDVKHLAYDVSLNCLPWAYPETSITETFTPGTTTITVIDACTANTNWPGTTAVTFLTQSAVRLGPVTAVSQGYLPHDPRLPSEGWVTGYGVSTTLTYSNGTSPSSGNYMYIDFAGTVSGLGSVFAPYLIGPSGEIAPVASQLQADGYMRYFWVRQSGPLTFRLRAFGMAAGDTANFYVDELGTATVIPSGSLFSLSTKGSVRTEARLRVSHPSTNGIGETLIYADPTMLELGWAPNQWSSSGTTAPDGTYWIYVQPVTAYVIGDVFSLTVAGQTVTTRVEHSNTDSHWIPMGPFQLGGRKSRQLGTVTGITNSSGLPQVALLKNGSGTGYTSIDARLIRESEDTALIHAWLTTATAYQSFFIEPASIDIPRPGMFAGTNTSGSTAVSVLSLIKSWGWPQLIPPTTALWIQCANTASPSVSVTHRPPFHTLAAEY